MSTLSQAHAVISRSGWLSFAPPLPTGRARPLRAPGIRGRRNDLFRRRPAGRHYGLVVGNFAISIAPGERGPYVGHFAQPGTWFGEAAAFTEQPRRIGLAVSRRTEALHLPLPAIREIVAVDPRALEIFRARVDRPHRRRDRAADDLLIRDHVKRSIAVLLRLGGCRYRTIPRSTCRDRGGRQPGKRFRHDDQPRAHDGGDGAAKVRGRRPDRRLLLPPRPEFSRRMRSRAMLGG